MKESTAMIQEKTITKTDQAFDVGCGVAVTIVVHRRQGLQGHSERYQECAAVESLPFSRFL